MLSTELYMKSKSILLDRQHPRLRSSLLSNSPKECLTSLKTNRNNAWHAKPQQHTELHRTTPAVPSLTHNEGLLIVLAEQCYCRHSAGE